MSKYIANHKFVLTSLETDAVIKRINEIDRQVNSSDFDPVALGCDELMLLVDKVEGNTELTQQLDDISKILQTKLIAIAMRALSEMEKIQ